MVFLKPCLVFGWLNAFFLNSGGSARGEKGSCPYLEGRCVTGSWDQRHLMDRGKFWNRPLMGSVVDCGLIDGLIVDRLMALGAVESVPGGYA